MTKDYSVIFLNWNGAGARDATGDAAPAGLQVSECTLLLDEEHPGEDLEAQTDWAGEYRTNSRVLLAVYVSEDGQQTGVVKPPAD